MSARTRYALIGVAIGLGCALFIIVRLVQAGAPQPTVVFVSNAAPAPLRLTRVVLGTENLLADELTLAEAVPGRTSAPFESKPIALPPGRAFSVTVLTSQAHKAFSCELEPRPQGMCKLRVVLDGMADLRCEYSCKPLDPS